MSADNPDRPLPKSKTRAATRQGTFASIVRMVCGEILIWFVKILLRAPAAARLGGVGGFDAYSSCTTPEAASRGCRPIAAAGSIVLEDCKVPSADIRSAGFSTHEQTFNVRGESGPTAQPCSRSRSGFALDPFSLLSGVAAGLLLALLSAARDRSRDDPRAAALQRRLGQPGPAPTAPRYSARARPPHCRPDAAVHRRPWLAKGRGGYDLRN